jgi:hypothetical protein
MLNTTNYKAKVFKNENEQPSNPFLMGKLFLNLGNITPSLEQGKRFYNNICNSSPFKLRSHDSTNCSGKTLTRWGTDEKKNLHGYSTSSPILSQSFVENAPSISSFKSPALTLNQSKKELLNYGKSKEFEEDLKYYNESKCSEIVEEEEVVDVVQSKNARIAELIKKLPVPVDKKNDEAFKIQAMKKMRKLAFPENKSARNYDIKAAHQEKLKEGIYLYNVRTRIC